MKLTKRDKAQFVSGVFLVTAVICFFTVTMPRVLLTSAIAFVFAVLSLSPQRAVLKKRQRIIGWVELGLSGVILAYALYVLGVITIRVLKSYHYLGF